MEQLCENCGQSALETDVECWHCGWRFVEREIESAVSGQPADDPPTSEALQGIGIHAGATLLVLLAAVLVMTSLGRYPLVQDGSGQRLGNDWEVITGTRATFTLSMPKDWEWYEPVTEREQTHPLARFTELFVQGTVPLGAEVSDLELLFAAASPQSESDRPPAIVVVTASKILNRLDYEEAIELLQEGGLALREVLFVDDFERTHLRIEVDNEPVSVGRDLLRCRQQFVRGQAEALLLSTCAPRDRFNIYQKTFDTILSSFQRLTS